MTHPRKVVHLITGLRVGGAETALYRLLQKADRQRFEHRVVCLLEDGPMAGRIAALGFPVEVLDMPPVPTPRHLATLRRLLARERPAVLQTWMYHANLLGLVAGRLAGVDNIVWNIRCSDCILRGGASPFTSWIFRLSAWLSHRPTAVVANSEAGRRYHEASGYRPRRSVVIPNGFDLERFAPDPEARTSVRAELGLPSDTLLIGLIGRYRPVKDHATFLRAALQLAGRDPRVHFLLVGEGVTAWHPVLRPLLEGRSEGERIHFLGERGDIPRLLAALDLLASSSRSEGFPNVVGEAMACGVPCVVTDVGDSGMIVGETGIVVPPGDADALSAAWEQLIQAGPEQRQALGRAARERVGCHYSLESIVGQYEELYQSLSRGEVETTDASRLPGRSAGGHTWQPRCWARGASRLVRSIVRRDA